MLPRAYVTGQRGFIARKLFERTDVEWVMSPHDQYDTIVLAGSPTLAKPDFTREDGRQFHTYVVETIQLLETIPQQKKVLFVSTQSPAMISDKHDGNMPYLLAKLFLENYIIHHRDNYQIHRMGTIISRKRSDIMMMKPDRIQREILDKQTSNLRPTEDYVFVEDAIDSIIGGIYNSNNDIVYYPSTTMTSLELIKLTVLSK